MSRRHRCAKCQEPSTKLLVVMYSVLAGMVGRCLWVYIRGL